MRKNSIHADLVATNAAGMAFTTFALALVAGALVLSMTPVWWLWLAGQILFALAFLEAFVLLHEAGHMTLFRSRSLNLALGYVAAFVALIPFTAWRHVHARHHLWTGWQDLDATTAALVPRPLGAWERRAIDFAWRSGLPLFSVLYRIQSYWNVRRLERFLDRPALRHIAIENLAYAAGYLMLIAWLGPIALLSLLGAGLLLGLAIQDPLLLSQHTHIPQRVSGGAKVRPFKPAEQAAFTRSLRFPAWFSRLILHFDAHELHHVFVGVPGYRLRALDAPAPNEVHWWTWLRGAKRMSGVDFLFSNREHTGVPW